MKKCLFLITIGASVSLIFGCAGHNMTAGNVATATAIDAAGGVPYAGVISLTATAVDIFANTGKPKWRNTSPGFSKKLKGAPFVMQMDSGYSKVIKWFPRRYKDGDKIVVVPVESTPQEQLDYAIVRYIAANRFQSGDFGDGGPEAVQKNLEAWRDGKLVVAEYKGPNGVKVLAVSDKNEPAELMLPEEWTTRNADAKKQ